MREQYKYDRSEDNGVGLGFKCAMNTAMIQRACSFRWEIWVGKWVKLVEIGRSGHFFVEVGLSRLKWVKVS